MDPGAEERGLWIDSLSSKSVFILDDAPLVSSHTLTVLLLTGGLLLTRHGYSLFSIAVTFTQQQTDFFFCSVQVFALIL